jgi:hypothetical protein
MNHINISVFHRRTHLHYPTIARRFMLPEGRNNLPVALDMFTRAWLNHTDKKFF